MFKATEAQQAVEEYYTRGEELSREWLTEQSKDVFKAIREAAINGRTVVSVDLKLQDDKYRAAKVKNLTGLLTEAGYIVTISAKKTGEILKEENDVVNISWGHAGKFV